MKRWLMIPILLPLAAAGQDKDPTEEVFEFGKTSLDALQRELIQLEKCCQSEITDHEYSQWSGPVQKHTRETVDAWFKDALSAMRELPKQLDAVRAAYKKKEIAIDAYYRDLYTKIADHIAAIWKLHLRAAGNSKDGKVQIIMAIYNRLHDPLQKEYEAGLKAIESLSGKEREIALAGLKARTVEADERLYRQIGSYYSIVYDRLVVSRRRLCRLAWKWYDFARLRSPKKKDLTWDGPTESVHDEGMILFYTCLHVRFEREGPKRSDIDWFVGFPGSVDRLSVSRITDESLYPKEPRFPKIEPTGEARFFVLRGLGADGIDHLRPKPNVKLPEKFEISKVVISLSAYEWKKKCLRAEVDETQIVLKKAQLEETETQEAVKKEEEPCGKLRAQLSKLLAELDATWDQVYSPSPPESMKDDAYRKLEKELHDAEARAEKTFKKMVQAREDNNPVNLFIERYEEEIAQVETLRKKVKAAHEAMKFPSSLREKAQEMEKAYLLLARRVREAESKLSDALIKAKYSTLRRLDAEEKANQALQAFKRLPSGLPVTSEIKVYPLQGEAGWHYYRSELWYISEALTKLDREIPELKARLEEATAKRKEAMAQFRKYSEQSIDAGKRRYWRVIMSAGSQMLVELAFFALDCKERGGGLAGVLVESLKKAAESLLFDGIENYGWKVYEPKADFDWAEWEGPLDEKKVMERGIKTTVTGPVAGAVTKGYLAEHSIKEFEKSWAGFSNATYGAVRGGVYQPSLYADVDSKLKAMNAAMDKFKKAVTSDASLGIWDVVKAPKGESLKAFFEKSLWDVGVKKFGWGLAKDAAKAQAKKLLGEWLDGESMRDALRAELASTMAYKLYWAYGCIEEEAEQKYRVAVEARAWLVEHYDFENHMKVHHKEKFTREHDVAIEITDTLGIQSKEIRDLEVFLGGVQAERIDSAKLLFVVPFDMLEECWCGNEGGVILELAFR